DEHASGYAVRVTLDAAARRVFRRLVDAGRPQRCAVGPPGVAIDPLEPGRPTTARRIELVRRRETPELPDRLVPAASSNPCGRAMLRRVGFYRSQRIAERLRRREIQLRVEE